MADNIIETITRQMREERVRKRKEHLYYSFLGLLLFLPPIALYFFIKWDPSLPFTNDDGEKIPVSAFLLVILYWTAIFQIHKYKERSKNRTWQLAQFLSDECTVEEREEKRIKLTSDFLWMSKLKEEYPELFESKFLKLPLKDERFV